jgi:hypothetical protein
VIARAPTAVEVSARCNGLVMGPRLVVRRIWPLMVDLVM